MILEMLTVYIYIMGVKSKKTKFEMKTMTTYMGQFRA